TGALRDKNNDEQTRFSEEYYNAIRNRKSKSDIDAIAKNTGFSTIQITNIRNHIFEEIHDLGDGRIERFDTDWRIAQAWQRLEQGKYNELDSMLLHHELYELTLMREKGYNYEEAHIEAHKKYPWGTLIKDEK
ncbi:MAG: hypothetical protein LBG90_05885, partial [Spirochaetaceae bacterium]|nr:hypothetical protein [Spirochaetaceae bacterium]